MMCQLLIRLLKPSTTAGVKLNLRKVQISLSEITVSLIGSHGRAPLQSELNPKGDNG